MPHPVLRPAPRHAVVPVALVVALLVLAAGPRAAAAQRDTAAAPQPRPDPLAPLVDEALRANLGRARDRLALERSDAAVREARGLYLPSVTFDTRRSYMDGVVNVGDFINPAYRALNQLIGSNRFPTDVSATIPQAQETRLRLAQPLYNPAIAANYRATTSLRAIEQARVGAAARQLAADVQLAYLSLASAERAADVYRATLPLVCESVRVTERLLANGRLTPDAVLRARAERGEVEQQLADAEQKRDAARRGLNMLLDRPLDAPVAVLPDSALAAPLDVTLDEALRRAAAGREELAQAAAATDAAVAQRRAASAAYRPTVAAALDYGLQGREYQLDSRSDVVVASLVVQWNVFNGGRDAARSTQASLDEQRARLQRTELARAVELEVRQAYDAAVVARRAIATAEDRRAAAQRAHELVQRRYEEGLATQIELLDARAAATRAALNVILTRQTYASRRVELERAAALRAIPDIR